VLQGISVTSPKAKMIERIIMGLKNFFGIRRPKGDPT
jgi:hypothetical protein